MVLTSRSKGSLTAEQTLFTVGLPGLGIEGLIEVGPLFSVDASATAEIDTSLHMSVDLAYNITNGHLLFPPVQNDTTNTSIAASQTSNGSFAPSDTSTFAPLINPLHRSPLVSSTGLQLSVNPSGDIHGRLEAHLIPTLAFGVAVLNGQTKATINLGLDASAALDLTINSTITTALDPSGLSVVTQDVWEGCVDVETGLAVEAGADADFFGLFDASTKVPLFGKTFQLFQKCFGVSSAGSRRDVVGAGRARRQEQLVRRDSWRSALPMDEWAQGSTLMKAVGGRVLAAASTGSGGSGFVCPAGGNELASLADQTVSGSR